MSAIKDLYDLERYFGAGHWISRDGKIEVPLKSAEHAEIAPDVVEKYYKDDFLDMDPNLSLSGYSDFLLGKGWIVHRESNFLCWRLDSTTKDTIFLFAKKNNISKITVETPQKVKLIKEPPEMLYEQKKPHSFYKKQKFQQLKEQKNLLERQYKFDLQQKFDEYNSSIFNNEITIAVSLSWNSQMRQKLGVMKYNHDNTGFWNVRIIISSFFDMSEQLFKDVLVHEMIHALFLQNGYPMNHGAEFINKANEINSKSGTHITAINDDPTITPEERLKNKIVNVVIKKNKNGQKSIALLGNKIMSAIMMIDWQKFATDRESYPQHAVEYIKLCTVTSDKTWRFSKSLSGKLKFQFIDKELMEDIENEAQCHQQLFP